MLRRSSMTTRLKKKIDLRRKSKTNFARISLLMSIIDRQMSSKERGTRPGQREKTRSRMP